LWKAIGKNGSITHVNMTLTHSSGGREKKITQQLHNGLNRLLKSFLGELHWS
jgi:hypothetical protein